MDIAIDGSTPPRPGDNPQVMTIPYLLFFAGLTNFEYTVTFRNVQTGQAASFKKEAGSFNGGVDNVTLRH